MVDIAASYKGTHTVICKRWAVPRKWVNSLHSDVDIYAEYQWLSLRSMPTAGIHRSVKK